MTLPQVSERSVRIAVLGFSVIGLIALGVIASLTEIEEVHLWEAEDHVGERVRVKGTLIGSYPSGSDSAWILLREGNSTLEVFIERGDGDIDPGSIVKAEGEVVTMDGYPTLTIQNEERLEIKGNGSLKPYSDSIGPNEVHFLTGLVKNSRYIGWDRQEVIISPILGSNTDPGLVRIDMMRIDLDLRTGDLVNITAYFFDRTNGFSYGNRDVEVLSRAEPRTITLLRLVEEMRDDPSYAPYEPVTLDAYIRYTPLGKSIYIADLVEGGDISIKARLKVPLDGAEKGDLVRLFNCSLSWDVDSMRFELWPEDAQIIETYGTWKLNLERLEYGLTEFEGALVELTGTVSEDDGHHYLVDGESSVQIAHWAGDMNSVETTVIGRVMFNSVTNIMYIETEVDLL